MSTQTSEKGKEPLATIFFSKMRKEGPATALKAAFKYAYGICKSNYAKLAMQSWARFLLFRLSNSIPPPDSYKQNVVRQYAGRFSLRILVETGTYLGEMVDSVRNKFDYIASIELDNVLYQRAVLRFAKWSYIRLYHGDSASVLPAILRSVNQPCLFWLDGHCSGGVTAKGLKETPVVEELRAILAHPIEDHVVLVDDARCFRGVGDWPTLEVLRSLVRTARPSWVFEVQHDVIRIHRSRP